MEVQRIDADRYNPFLASEQELLAYALDDAGLVSAETAIDGRPAREHLQSFYAKRELYRESTKLGDLLVRQGVLTQIQLAAALKHQVNRPGVKLGEVVLGLGFCRIEDLERALEAQARIRIDLDDLAAYRSQISAIRERLRAAR